MKLDELKQRERINRRTHPFLFPLLLYPLVCLGPLLLGWTVFVEIPGLGPDVRGVFQVMCALFPTYWVMCVHWPSIQAINELPIPSRLFTRAGFKAALKDFRPDPRRSLRASCLFLVAPCVGPLKFIVCFCIAAASGRLAFILTGKLAFAFPAAVVMGFLAADLLNRLAALAVENQSVSHVRRVGRVGTQAEAKRNLRTGRRV